MLYSKSTRGTVLYNENNFYVAFMRDVKHAKRIVMIESPFLTQRRTDQLLPILARLLQRGVKVVINTKNPAEYQGQM